MVVARDSNVKTTMLLSSFLISITILLTCGSSLANTNSGNNDIIAPGKVNGHPIVNLIIGGETTTLSKCPKGCTCTSLTVDCSQKGFVSIPPNLPTNVERL